MEEKKQQFSSFSLLGGSSHGPCFQSSLRHSASIPPEAGKNWWQKRCKRIAPAPAPDGRKKNLAHPSKQKTPKPHQNSTRGTQSTPRAHPKATHKTPNDIPRCHPRRHPRRHPKNTSKRTPKKAPLASPPTHAPKPQQLLGFP